MKKKVVSILIAGALVASLAACGGDSSQSSSDQTDTSASSGGSSTSSQTQQSGSTSDDASSGGERNLYGFDEPVTVKIGVSYAAASDFTFYGGETVEDNAWMDLYKANNIIPEILYEVDPSQADAKLSTAIMSGDYPDVFFGTGSEYENYVESGAVADITEAYEKYASDELKEYMTAYDNGKALESLYVDGKLYGLPRVNDSQAGAHVMWIRQDWLDNLNLDMPTTMEELAEVAHAFTYDDPDGNGANDTYGLVLDGVNVINNSVGNTEPIFRAFGSYLGTDGLTYIEDGNGEITWGGSDAESMKAALQWLADLYADGSLVKDFITMDSESVFTEAGAGRAGIWFGPNWGGMNPAIDATQNDTNCHIVAAAVPTGTDEETKAYAATSVDTVYFVSSQCENPELLIKLFNLSVKYQNADSCTAEEYNMYFGDSENWSGWKTSIIAGEAPNGRSTNTALVTALETGDDSALTAKQLENYVALQIYVDAVEGGTLDPTDTNQQRGLSLYTVHADERSAWSVLWKMMEQDDYVYAAYNGVPSQEVSEISTTLQKQLVETIVKIITGAADVDSYDSFLDTWYALGGQTAMDEANASR